LYISSEVAAHEGQRRDSFLKVVVKGRRSRRRIATSKAEFEKVFESSEAMALKVVESELFDRRVAAARGW
jgi:hypothetical protein